MCKYDNDYESPKNMALSQLMARIFETNGDLIDACDAFEKQHPEDEACLRITDYAFYIINLTCAVFDKVCAELDQCRAKIEATGAEPMNEEIENPLIEFTKSKSNIEKAPHLPEKVNCCPNYRKEQIARILALEEICHLSCADPKAFFSLMANCLSDHPVQIDRQSKIKLEKMNLIDEYGYSPAVVCEIMQDIADEMKRSKEKEQSESYMPDSPPAGLLN